MTVLIFTSSRKRKPPLFSLACLCVLPLAALTLKVLSHLGYVDSVALIGPLVMGAITLLIVGVSMSMQNPFSFLANFAISFVMAFVALVITPL